MTFHFPFPSEPDSEEEEEKDMGKAQQQNKGQHCPLFPFLGHRKQYDSVLM